ncbi:hypothetical protein BASA81_015230 [Batrachochytrium salamandrivorans]|nr:hypothetical protein BASA81_015230 [Batrachochytrium salamandrivorans]
MAIYQKQKESIIKLENPGEVEQEERETRPVMEKLEKELETGNLPGDEKSEESVYELDGVADREKDLEKQFELSQVRGKAAESHNKLLKELSLRSTSVLMQGNSRMALVGSC